MSYQKFRIFICIIVLLLIHEEYSYCQKTPSLYPKIKDGKYGFYDRNGNLVINNIYDEALGFSEGLAAVKKDGKWGYIDESGAITINFTYEDAWYFTDGLAAVKKDGKWGYIDKTGKVKINFLYEDAGDFSEGLAWVQQNKKIGFIDKNGNVIIDFQYGAATSFENGLAGVQKNYKWGFIDKSGNLVINYKYDEVKCFDNELAPVKMINKWGFIDTKGNLIIDYTYDKIEQNYKNASFAWTYAESAYSLANKNLNDPQLKKIFFDHLYNAITMIQNKDTYLDSYEWEKLYKYYKLLGEEEKAELAKKTMKNLKKDSHSSHSDEKFNMDLSFGIGPLKYLLSKRELLPLEGQLRINNIIITMLYINYDNFNDKWRFGAWMGSDEQKDVSNTYSGYDFSIALKFVDSKDISEKKLGYGHSGGCYGVDFRYGSYLFNPILTDVTQITSNFNYPVILKPTVKRYDVSFIMGFNHSQVPFFFDINFSMGLGYRTIDTGYDFDKYIINDERFLKEKWTGLAEFYLPIRIGFRVGLTIL